MKRSRLAPTVIALALMAGCTSAANTDATSEAVVAAEAWLAVVDAGRYGDSWDASASLFQAALSREAWEKTLSGVRSSLGTMTSRSLSRADYTTSLPGAPDGEYVVIQFSTSFSNKSSAVETVTPMKDGDGIWRVSGYFIK